MELDAPDVLGDVPAAAAAGWVIVGGGVAASLAVAWLIARRIRRGLPAVPPRPHPQAPWSGGDVVATTLSFLGFQVLAAAAVPPTASLQLRLAAGAGAMLAATGVSMLQLMLRGCGRGALGCGLGHLGADLRLAVGGLALLLAPLLGLAAILDRIVPYRHAIVDFLKAHHDVSSVALVVFAAVVAAPIAEEFLFRRVLQGWLERRLDGGAIRGGGGLAVGLSSLAFALAHVGQGLAWVPLFFFGLVVGHLARQTGSIVPGVILHALFNAVSVGLVLLQVAEPAAGGG